MQYAQFYDQVMKQIEAGQAKNALIQLSGMLDATSMNAGGLAAAGDVLRQHDLYSLMQRALIGRSGEGGGRTSAFPALFDTPALSHGFDPTTKRVFAAMQEIPPVSAILKRADHAGRIIARAWQDGRSICLSGTGYSEALRQLDRRDLSNISVCGAQQQFETLDEALASAQRFDLIYAPDVLLETKADALSATLTRITASLEPDGMALMTSLMPNHLGSGWRQLCLGWDPECHGEESLSAAADLAGIKARIYDDSEGCILWCELVRADENKRGSITA